MYSLSDVFDLSTDYIRSRFRKGEVIDDNKVKFTYISILYAANLLDYKSRKIVGIGENFKRFSTMREIDLFSSVGVPNITHTEGILIMLIRNKDLKTSDPNNINLNTVHFYDPELLPNDDYARFISKQVKEYTLEKEDKTMHQYYSLIDCSKCSRDDRIILSNYFFSNIDISRVKIFSGRDKKGRLIATNKWLKENEISYAVIGDNGLVYWYDVEDNVVDQPTLYSVGEVIDMIKNDGDRALDALYGYISVTGASGSLI